MVHAYTIHVLNPLTFLLASRDTGKDKGLKAVSFAYYDLIVDTMHL